MIVQEELLEKFAERAEKIMTDSRDIELGFEDDMYGIYTEFYGV